MPSGVDEVPFSNRGGIGRLGGDERKLEQIWRDDSQLPGARRGEEERVIVCKPRARGVRAGRQEWGQSKDEREAQGRGHCIRLDRVGPERPVGFEPTQIYLGFWIYDLRIGVNVRTSHAS